jgi:hypothetical protein
MLQFKYTSVDGGDSLKAAAAGAVDTYAARVQSTLKEQGLTALFDVKNEFAAEWARAVTAAAFDAGARTTGSGAEDPTTQMPMQTLKLTALNAQLPFYATRRTVTATTAYLLCDVLLSSLPQIQEKKSDAKGGVVNGKAFGLEFVETIGKNPGGLQKYGSAVLSSGSDGVSVSEWEISIAGKDLMGMKRMWLLVGFVAG